jgi:plastocyanin
MTAAAVLIPAAALGAAPPGAAPRAAAKAAQPPHPAARKVRTVIIEGLRYRPGIVEVKRGEPVRWVNEDPVPHTVTAAGRFDSHSIAPEGSWTYVPERTGEYDYTCRFHPTMKGKLEVR